MNHTEEQRLITYEKSKKFMIISKQSMLNKEHGCGSKKRIIILYLMNHTEETTLNKI